jgi:predicted  nucleic acid-binding Zn-ribbon protein
MPHECTACGRQFPDGSKEMLSGCPDCGGTKFQFQPTVDGGGDTDDPGPSSPPAPDDDSVTGRAWPTYGDEPSDDRRVRGTVGPRARDPTAPDGDPTGPNTPDADTTQPPESADADPSSRDDDIVVADEEPVQTGGEDAAQADARSGVVAPDEVAAGVAQEEDPDPDAGDDPASPAGGAESPDLSTLRRELNDQFESIRIVSPGQYELNLMELYEREEHIISLREDGRYVIEVPETWRGE